MSTQLYTSLTHLKRALEHGVAPAMTPVPESLHDLIDPAFTIGLGALMEDPVKGLRCPVRGCGQFAHQMRKHLNTVHANVGGAARILAALSIPANVSLISQRFKTNAKKGQDQRRPETKRPDVVRARLDQARKKPRPSVYAKRDTTGHRNLLGRCVAQLGQQLVTLTDELGHSPTADEARAALGTSVIYYAVEYFGTWNKAKYACGLSAIPARGRRPEATALAEAKAEFDAWDKSQRRSSIKVGRVA